MMSKLESCWRRSVRNAAFSVFGLVVDGCSGDVAVVVEHSLSGLADLVAGAVVEGVSGWDS